MSNLAPPPKLAKENINDSDCIRFYFAGLGY